LRLSKINCPAFEKILSDGTEVATKVKYFFASLLSIGLNARLDFHHSRGSFFLCNCSSDKYDLNSMKANAVGFSTFVDLLVRSNCCQTKSSSALLSPSGASTLSPFEREKPEVDADAQFR
jgi:hypothetical protein